MQVQLTPEEVQEQTREHVAPTLEALAREGARWMLATALELEVQEYLAQHQHLRGEDGLRQVVRNGRAAPRKVVIGGLAVPVQAPRVDDRREGEKFTSQLLPPYLRRSQRLDQVLPLLYLRGLSTGDFAPALEELLGEAARGFSPTNIVRLKESWEAEYREWRERDLTGTDYVYVWADGVNFSIRLEEDRLTCLVLLGVRRDGTKELIALEDGYRESEEAWLTLLRDLKKRGMPAPALAVGDGALGFWKALAEVYPEAKQQRCWVHKLRNVLDKLPDRLQERAKELLRQVMYAESEAAAETARETFVAEFEAKHEKAVTCLVEDWEELLTFMRFPAEHWVHLRTSNVIESVFSPAKVRTKKTKGAGSRTAGLAMAYKLVSSAQRRWRRVNAPHLVRLIREGVRFKDGKIVPSAGAELPQSEPEGITACPS
jgi:transposase-like protein